jgi:hypothetical protein
MTRFLSLLVVLHSAGFLVAQGPASVTNYGPNRNGQGGYATLYNINPYGPNQNAQGGYATTVNVNGPIRNGQTGYAVLSAPAPVSPSINMGGYYAPTPLIYSPGSSYYGPSRSANSAGTGTNIPVLFPSTFYPAPTSSTGTIELYPTKRSVGSFGTIYSTDRR